MGILAIDGQRRVLQAKVDSVRAERRRISEGIGTSIKGGADPDGQEVARLRGQSTWMGAEVEGLETRLAEIQAALDDLLLRIPNPPDPGIPVGGEEASLVVRTWGDPAAHEEAGGDGESWVRRPHWEVAEGLGMLDLAAGAKVTGSGFPLYKGAGAALQRGVIDALAYFDTGFGQIEAAGIEMRMLPRPKEVPLIGGLFISARADFLKANRKLATGFARAVNKSSEFLLANPEAGARVFIKLFPETARRGASEADAVKSILFAAKRRIPLYRPPYPNTKMGFIHEAELLLDAKFLGLDSIKDVKPLMTNELIDDINNYDREKIIAQAKAYKA